MKKLTATKGLEKEKWLMYRKRGIGGSDAGAVCGLNPYRTGILFHVSAKGIHQICVPILRFVQLFF